MLSPDSLTLITNKNEILEKWAQHFDSVLNLPSFIIDEAAQHFLQVSVILNFNIFPSEDEADKAIKQMSTSKTPVPEVISAKVFKCDDPSLVR